jgi:rhodanese-related sulfurtransferase
MAAGEPTVVSREEARERVAAGAQLLDVRTDREWEAGHIEGAAHIDLPDLPARVGELDGDRPVVVYCRTGNRSEMAVAALAAAGYDAVKMDEGMVGWSEAGFPLEPTEGYVAESGDAAAVLEQRKRAAQSGS